MIYFLIFQIILSTTSSSLISELNRTKRFSRQRGSNSMKMIGYGTRVEELLNPDTYHKYIRPGIDTASPLNISISMAITSMDKISDADMEYTITFTLYQTWRDDRLESKSRVLRNLSKPVTMDWSVSERMWVPDTYIVNAKTSFIHEVTTKNALLILYPNGTVIYVLRITSRVACPMKLFKYPMDGQVCNLKFASWSFPVKDLNYMWSGPLICGSSYGSVVGMENVVLPQFNVTRCDIYSSSHERNLDTSFLSSLSSCQEKATEALCIGRIQTRLGIDKISKFTGLFSCFFFDLLLVGTHQAYYPRIYPGNYSELVMEFGLKRNVRFFFMQTYVPSILLVMLSWVSFWINVNAVPARVALGITTVLSMTTLMIGVYNSGPKSTSYVKAIDLYVLVCYGFIFSAMIEFAGVHYYLRHGSSKSSVAAASRKLSNESNNSPKEVEKEDEPTKSTFIAAPGPAQESSKSNGIKKQKESTKAGASLQPSVEHKMKVDRIDLFFMIAFPIIFGLFNATYWGVYLTMKD